MKQLARVAIIVTALSSTSLRASIFGEENVLLLQLVTTTASQLNELEKLLSNAEKYTQKIQQYNELVQDEFFKAERVMYLAESIAAKREIGDLGELNAAISDLKDSMGDLRVMMREYALIKDEAEKTKKITDINRKINKKKSRIASSQVRKSINAKNSGRAAQLTAQNTSLMLESNVDMHNTQIELLEKVAVTNKLLAEQMEEKRKQDLIKAKTYGDYGAIK